MATTSDSMPSASNSVASISNSMASTSMSADSALNSMASISNCGDTVTNNIHAVLLSEHHMAHILRNLPVKWGCGKLSIVNNVWKEASKTSIAMPVKMVVREFPVNILQFRGFQYCRLNLETLEVLEPLEAIPELVGHRVYLDNVVSKPITCRLDFALFCDNLTKLTIQNCKRRDVLKLATVVQTLKKLTELDLRQCFVRPKNHDLGVLFAAIGASSVKILRIESPPARELGSLKMLAHLDQPTHLENLKLVDCEAHITREAVNKMIIANRGSLGRLYLGKFSPDELTLALTEAHYLTKLEIGNVERRVADDDSSNRDVEMEEMTSFPKFELKQVTKLRWLFGQCPVCVYTNWKDMAMCFPYVTELSIRRSDNYHCKKFRVNDRGMPDYDGFLVPPPITFEEGDVIGDMDPHLLLWLRLWPNVKVLKLSYNACTVYRGNIWGKMILPVMLNVPSADILYVAKPHMSETEVNELNAVLPGMSVQMHKVKEISYLLVRRGWK